MFLARGGEQEEEIILIIEDPTMINLFRYLSTPLCKIGTLAVNFSPVATKCTLAFHVLKCLNTARGKRLLVEFDSARIVSWFVCTTYK